MRILCMILILTTAAAAQDGRYGLALQRAEQELARVIEEQPVMDSGTGNLKAWLKALPELRQQVECARACAFISGERVLEGGGLEVDLSLPVRWLPGAVIAQWPDPGRYLTATGSAPAHVGGSHTLSSEDFWSRRVARTTAYTAFRFTGMTREESERDALVRSRGEALSLLSRSLFSLNLPDGRMLGGLVPGATHHVPLPPRVGRSLRQTYYSIDRAESSAEVDYELPLLPLAASLGLLSRSPTEAVPEAAQAAARAAARRDIPHRIDLWSGRDADVRKWLESAGADRLVETVGEAVRGAHVFVVEMEISPKQIPGDINKRLYADRWFPLVCRGYATW